MRIQHNITAMNSYRNFNTNNSQLSKNLEKLSSGYKINRAGDDAAGLAISEKMRAQITGLEGATKNAKDGISLIQTAEGALTEVHDMLNRMVTLTEQSANGTYADDVDREQLQKEVDALKSEINRIADSTNFNGLKLLDGSLSGASQVKNLAINTSEGVKGRYNQAAAFAITDKLVGTAAGTLTKDDIGKTLDYTVTWQDKNGNEKTTTVSLTFQGDGTGSINTDSGKIVNNYFTDAAGKKYNVDSNGKLTAANLNDAFKTGLGMDDEFSAAFKVENADKDGSAATNKLYFEAREAGDAGARILSIGMSETTSMTKEGVFTSAGLAPEGISVEETQALNSMQKFNANDDIDVAKKSDSMDEIKAKIFEIDGHKFLAQKDLTDNQIKALGDDITIVKVSDEKGSLVEADFKAIAADVQRVTGLATKAWAAAQTDGSNIAAGDITFTKDTLNLAGKDLKLQIGDTSDSFNKLSVTVGDMHVATLGLADVDISTQEGASDAMDKIKNAVNLVSDTRGTLGALQNRLDHTINNLGVMRENIQNAESTIRDTDVAEEMMTYTKNNILNQSAQAMLAQANQLPQGVLQLLG